mgnify:CR=1 FL=1
MEIIYLKNKENNQKSHPRRENLIDRKPIRTVNKINHSVKKQVKKKKRKRPRFYIGIFIAFLIISAFLFTSHNAGYVPVRAFLQIKEPSGNINEIDYSEIEKNYPITECVPEIRDIKHKLYESDETLQVISENYKEDLLNEGYKLKYNGVKNIKGFDVHYQGYTKGITAVVILLTSDEIDMFDSDTLVLYSTGDIFSYKKIINKYSSNLEL